MLRACFMPALLIRLAKPGSAVTRCSYDRDATAGHVRWGCQMRSSISNGACVLGRLIIGLATATAVPFGASAASAVSASSIPSPRSAFCRHGSGVLAGAADLGRLVRPGPGAVRGLTSRSHRGSRQRYDLPPARQLLFRCGSALCMACARARSTSLRTCSAGTSRTLPSNAGKPGPPRGSMCS